MQQDRIATLALWQWQLLAINGKYGHVRTTHDGDDDDELRAQCSALSPPKSPPRNIQRDLLRPSSSFQISIACRSGGMTDDLNLYATPKLAISWLWC